MNENLVVDDFGLCALSKAYQQIVYENISLPAGSHIIKIVLTGLKNPSSSDIGIGLDYFEVGGATLTPTPTPVLTPAVPWEFNETSGSTAYDTIGSNDGTVTGATWTTVDGCNCLDLTEAITM